MPKAGRIKKLIKIYLLLFELQKYFWQKIKGKIAFSVYLEVIIKSNLLCGWIIAVSLRVSILSNTRRY